MGLGEEGRMARASPLSLNRHSADFERQPRHRTSVGREGNRRRTRPSVNLPLNAVQTSALTGSRSSVDRQTKKIAGVGAYTRYGTVLDAILCADLGTKFGE